MNFQDYLFLFLGMGAVTYFPRALPLLYLAHKKIPQGLVDWLGLIPVAVLSALLAPALFISGQHELSFAKSEFLVAVPTLLFAVKTRSLGGTVLVGMMFFWLTKWII